MLLDLALIDVAGNWGKIRDSEQGISKAAQI